MKICILTETYFPVVGGGETQARLLAEGLVRRGHPVIILTRRTDPSLAKIERYGEITVYRLPPTGKQHLKKWGLLWSSFAALYRLRHQYDLVLVSGFRVIGIAAVVMSKLLHKACLLKADNNGEMSGEYFRGGLEKLGWDSSSPVFKYFLTLRNRLLRKADGFIAISSQISAELATCGVTPPSKIHCIPNSVDTTLFRPVSPGEKAVLRKRLALPDRETLVMYTGRLVRYKGLFVLLQVWKQLQLELKNAALILVGGGSLDIYNAEAQLKEYVRSNGLDGSVFFTGEVRRVHEYLQCADIFVFPTEKEAFGISVIEAMACGLPVIATNVGGLRDLLVDGQNGIVVPAGDTQELHHALATLLLNPPCAEELARSAARTARERYDHETVTEAYTRVFSNFHT